MGWVRVSDDFYDDPKFGDVGPLGMAMWIAGLAWCNRNLSDGYIPRSAVQRLLDFETVVETLGALEARNGVTNAGRNVPRNKQFSFFVAENLAQEGLWETTEGGFRIHQYLKYQRSAAQIKAASAANAARQRRFRQARKHNGVSNAGRNGGITGNPNPSSKTLRTTPLPPTDSLRSSVDPPARKPASTSNRGTRIPEGFTVTEEMRTWAMDRVPELDVMAETENFIDWWHQKPGKAGEKLDWVATWRVWMRRAAERVPMRPFTPEHGGRSPSAMAAKGQEWLSLVRSPVNGSPAVRELGAGDDRR